MVMDYLKERAEKAVDNEKVSPPDWVSNKNASMDAWHYIEVIRKEKTAYIDRHYKVTDYLTQKTFQIKGAEIAKALGVSRASLMNTSSYSPHLRAYLDKVNTDLVEAKEAKLEKNKKNSSRGSVRSSKEELVRTNTELRQKIIELEAQQSRDLVAHAFDQLPLPLRKKLGIS